MLDNLKTWYFPQTIEEALSLLVQNEVIPHAGGTFILRTGKNRVRALLDLNALPLKTLHATENEYSIGSNVTFSEIAAWTALIDSAAILRQAAAQAASAPLRNRITLGGSLAARPIWSDLPAVLVALDALIEIQGAVSGSFSAEEFYASSPLDGASLITAMRIPKRRGVAAFKRITRTRFDYSMLDVACSLSLANHKIGRCCIAVSCATPKVVRLMDVEQQLLGQSPEHAVLSPIIEGFNFSPVNDMRASKAYKIALLKITLKRMLSELFRCANSFRDSGS